MPLPKVWVYAEGEDGKATSATLELLTKAREIGDTVEAVYSGADADTIAPQLGEYGATKVHSVDHGSSLSGVVGGALLAKLVAGPHPLRAELRRARRDGTALGEARPAGADQRQRGRGRR